MSRLDSGARSVGAMTSAKVVSALICVAFGLSIRSPTVAQDAGAVRAARLVRSLSLSRFLTPSPPRSIAVSDVAGRTIACAESGEVVEWWTSTGLMTACGATTVPNAVAVGYDASGVWAIGDGLYRLDSASSEWRRRGGPFLRPNAVAIVERTQRIITAHRETLRVIDGSTGAVAAEFVASACVADIQCSESGSLILVRLIDGSTLLRRKGEWELGPGNIDLSTTGPSESFFVLASGKLMRIDESGAAVGGFDCPITAPTRMRHAGGRLWIASKRAVSVIDVEGAATRGPTAVLDAAVTCLAVAPSGEHAVVGCEDGGVRVISRSDLAVKMGPLAVGVRDVTISDNGRVLAACGEAEAVVWEIGSRDLPPARIDGVSAPIALSRDGRKAAFLARDGKAVVTASERGGKAISPPFTNVRDVRSVVVLDSGTVVVGGIRKSSPDGQSRSGPSVAVWQGEGRAREYDVGSSAVACAHHYDTDITYFGGDGCVLTFDSAVGSATSHRLPPSWSWTPHLAVTKRLVAAASQSAGWLRIWVGDPAAAQMADVAFEWPIVGVCAVRHRDWIGVALRDGSVRFIDSVGSEQVRVGRDAGALSVRSSSDASVIVTRRDDAALVWRPAP
jgi:hypothetical protein